MLIEQQNEDYDISNRIISEYLNGIEILKKFENLEDQSIKIDHKPSNKKQREMVSETLPQVLNEESIIFKFIESKTILKSINKSFKLFSNLLFEVDKQQVHERIMENINNISKKSLFLRKKLVLWIFFLSCIFFLFLSIFHIQFLYIFLIFIIFKLLLFWVEIFTKIIESIFFQISYITESYIKSNQKLIYFLKEIELVSLSYQKKFFFENISMKYEPKTNSENLLSDRLNHTYRRQAFNLLKRHFFKLRSINQVFLSEIKSASVDNANLMSIIKPEELSKIFTSNDNELDKLTDQFSTSCLKSICNFNNLLISEHIKLILIDYIDSFANSKWFFMKLIMVLKNLFSFYFLMNKLNIQLNQFDGFLKLGTTKTKIVLFDKESDSHKSEYKLQLQTRHFLLSLNKFNSLKGEIEKSKQLSVLKNNFENCKFYFDDVLKYHESETKRNETNSVQKQKDNDKSKTDHKKWNFTEEKTNLIFNEDQQIIDDEIIEADTSLHLLKENQNENQNENQKNEVDYFKEKELQLLNKNLFYELKFALKSRKNEWISREKIAKQKFNFRDYKSMEETVRYNSTELNDDYLLENDFFKYKASIGKRRKVNKIKTMEEKVNLKYSYQPEINEIVSKIFLPVQDELIREIINKRTNFQGSKLETLFESES